MSEAPRTKDEAEEKAEQIFAKWMQCKDDAELFNLVAAALREAWQAGHDSADGEPYTDREKLLAERDELLVAQTLLFAERDKLKADNAEITANRDKLWEMDRKIIGDLKAERDKANDGLIAYAREIVALKAERDAAFVRGLERALKIMQTEPHFPLQGIRTEIDKAKSGK